MLVYDLWSRRLLRVIPLASEGAAGPRPIDLAAPCHTVYASAGGNKTHWVDTLEIVPELVEFGRRNLARILR